MLESIHIKNIALIDDTTVEFQPGLNILSGETGAGKSILVDAMNLVLGERADRELIKSGKDRAEVEAVLFVDHPQIMQALQEYDLDADDALVVSRRLTLDGKNVCRINGHAVSLSVLKEIMDAIVDLHGQHEHQTLLNAKTHIHFVDDFAGSPLADCRNKMRQCYHQFHETQKKLEQLGGSEAEIARQTNLLQFEIDEITQAHISVGEQDALKDELQAALHAEKIADALQTCHRLLYAQQDSLCDQLSHVSRQIEEITAYSSDYATLAERLSGVYYDLQDVAQEAGDAAQGVFFDEQRVAEIQQRLDLLEHLQRKYGGSEQAVLDYLAQAEQKLDDYHKSGERRIQYQQELQTQGHALYALYQQQSALRKKAAADLEKLIVSELDDLGMPGSKFSVRFSALPAEQEIAFSQTGPETLEFFISTNPGEPEKPLCKTASGGEISRIMLAFKSVFAFCDQTETLIFDEIDTGISGRMAQVVARKMSKISKNKQVICVTHLPQIASYGDVNYLIEKTSAHGHTSTNVILLDEESKIAEIARLSGGSSELACAHARDMILKAEEDKTSMHQ